MKKTRIIVLALAISIALMGAGYAAWTQNVTISGTVKTGQLELKITDTATGAYYKHYDSNNELKWTNEELEKYGLKIAPQEEPTVNNKITFNRENLFPGLEAGKSINITNTGTVPVKLESVIFSNLDADQCGNVKLAIYISKNPTDVAQNGMIGNRFKISDLHIDGNVTSTYHDLELLPGKTYQANISAYVEPDVEDDEDETSGFTCELQFIQSNLQHQ